MFMFLTGKTGPDYSKAKCTVVYKRDSHNV